MILVLRTQNQFAAVNYTDQNKVFVFTMMVVASDASKYPGFSLLNKYELLSSLRKNNSDVTNNPFHNQ